MDAAERSRDLTPADERRQPAGSDPWWTETWYFDFTTPDASLGGFVEVVLLANQPASGVGGSPRGGGGSAARQRAGVCGYRAWIVGRERQPVMVVDDHVPLPPGRSLELRTEGLWADHIVEVPFDHMTLGCEAFGLRLDDPLDALAPDPLGERIPFGLDLEWETAGAVTALSGPAASPDGDGEPIAGYTIPSQVHGEVLIADERIELDGVGYRRHTWGAGDPGSTVTTTATGTLSDGAHFHTRVEPGPTPDRPPGDQRGDAGDVAPAAPPAAPLRERDAVDAGNRRPGLNTSTTGSFSTVDHLDLGGTHLTVVPVAFAPVTTRVAGGLRRVVRALCRYADETGRTGAGWVEHHQPG